MSALINNSKLRFVSESSKLQRLSILVIGSYECIEVLKPVLLFENSKKYAGRLHLQFCETIEEIKNSSLSDISSDYIVIVMDPKDRGCISKVESTIEQIDQTYLCGRLCLVNSKCDSNPSEWGVPWSYFAHISDRYKVNLINGDITIPDKSAYLSERMLLTATSVCGYKTGFPVTLDPLL